MEIEQVIAFTDSIDELFDIRETPVSNRVALKLGSDVVVGPNGRFNARLISRVARSCSDLMDLPQQPYEFIIITSGAFALGAEEMKRHDDMFDPRAYSIETRQVVASIGQIDLAYRWEQAFKKYSKNVVQFLISDHDWIGKDPEDTQRKIENLRRPLLQALAMRMIPLDNGNDGTNNFGMMELVSSVDNDPLSVIRAFMARAKYMILGTNANGVLDVEKKVISEITSLDDLGRVFDHGKSNGGMGGILSKVRSGVAFGRGGREAFIVNGRQLYAVEDILAGKIGTRIAIAA